MKKMRKLLCICLAAATVTVGAAFAVAAATTSATQFADNKDVISYQESIKELEAKQKELKDKLKNVQSNRYTAQQKSAYYNELILSTEKKIETAQNLLDALTVQIGEKENAIAEKEVEITEKTAEVNTTREKFLLMIRAQYESENTDALSVVVGADDMSDLLSRVENAANLLSYNSKLLEKFKTEKQQLEDMKSVLESTKAELESTKAEQETYAEELLKEQSALEEQKGDSDRYIASLRKTEAQITAEYEAAQKAEAEENARLENLLKQLAKANQSDYVGGKFIWPCDLSVKRISSGYGYRTYYIYGKKVTDFHRGIDIPSAVGTDIYAAQTGKVVVATKHSSYGNYIVVDHGGGISTLYAHCSKLLVSVGDTVKQGNHIAEMGATGNVTGPHLHFEVRVDGKIQDPIANGWVVQPK